MDLVQKLKIKYVFYSIFVKVYKIYFFLASVSEINIAFLIEGDRRSGRQCKLESESSNQGWHKNTPTRQ